MNKIDVIEVIITLSVLVGLITGMIKRKGCEVTVKKQIIKYILIETAMMILLADNIRRLKQSENKIDWISAGIYLTATTVTVIKKYRLIFSNLKKE